MKQQTKQVNTKFPVDVHAKLHEIRRNLQKRTGEDVRLPEANIYAVEYAYSRLFTSKKKED